ncbi:MetQ/NlpA family ABC transporter substrate-binding protein [Rhodospirillaceae bacterium SYSU D60014]|uniref:MetQ/NlpA family ABC transporter substrate-binding protein n=1 Tax=Virgifigura deserti TaxID=2268457 RepID=UPI000E66D939
MKSKWSSLLFAALAVLSFGATAPAAEPLKVGIMSGDEEVIWEEVQKVAAERGLELELIVFSDYVLPNEALNAGDLDANAFQHKPYLDSQVETHGYEIVSVGTTFVTPIGLYSSRVKSVDELQTGAVIGIPNDPSNGGRGLLLLEAQGLITLAPGVGITPSVIDIVKNPKELEIQELDAAQLARSLADLDAAVINTNYAREAGLNPRTDAVAIESTENNPYNNLIAVRAEDKDKPFVRELVAAFQSPEIRDFIDNNFGGAFLPAF